MVAAKGGKEHARAVQLAETKGRRIKDTPISFRIQERFNLFICILPVTRKAVVHRRFIAAALGLAPRNADVFGSYNTSVLCVYPQHRHLPQPVLTPGKRIAAQPFRQHVADQRLRAAAAHFILHPFDNRFPVVLYEVDLLRQLRMPNFVLLFVQPYAILYETFKVVLPYAPVIAPI